MSFVDTGAWKRPSGLEVVVPTTLSPRRSVTGTLPGQPCPRAVTSPPGATDGWSSSSSSATSTGAGAGLGVTGAGGTSSGGMTGGGGGMTGDGITGWGGTIGGVKVGGLSNTGGTNGGSRIGGGMVGGGEIGGVAGGITAACTGNGTVTSRDVESLRLVVSVTVSVTV